MLLTLMCIVFAHGCLMIGSCLPVRPLSSYIGLEYLYTQLLLGMRTEGKLPAMYLTGQYSTFNSLVFGMTLCIKDYHLISTIRY